MSNTDTITRADPNDWTWWQNALKGEFGPIHDGDCQTGYYRVRRRGRDSDSPVAYWIDAKTGEQRCHMDGENFELQRARELWNYACKKPITSEMYGERVRTGTWPGESEVVTRSNNAPDDNSFEGIHAQIDALTTEANRLMKAGAATTQAAADEASDVADKLGKLFTKADNARKVEGQPHLDAVRDVNDKWRPLTEAASIYKRLKDAVTEPWLKAQSALKAKAEREAREAAAKAAREAEEKQLAAKLAAQEAARKGDTKAAEEAQALAEQAQKVAAQAEAKADAVAATPIKAGTRGRATSLRTSKVAEIVDFEKLLLALKDHADVRAVVEKIANSSARAGLPLPGMLIKTEQSAA